jgi:hypothetical protein
MGYSLILIDDFLLIGQNMVITDIYLTKITL